MVGCVKDMPLDRPLWYTSCPQVRGTLNLVNMKVGDLIDRSSKKLNHKLVRKLYQYPLIEEILQIPLAKTDGGQDRIIWNYSSGDFQV